MVTKSNFTKSAEESYIEQWSEQPELDPSEFNSSMVTGLDNVLPTLPNIPTYVTGWVPISTDVQNNTSRTIGAQRQGWRPISYEEYRQYDPHGAETYRFKQGGSHVIQIKDLIACKISTIIYDKIQAAQYRLMAGTNQDNLRSDPFGGVSGTRTLRGYQEEDQIIRDGVTNIAGRRRAGNYEDI